MRFPVKSAGFGVFRVKVVIWSQKVLDLGFSGSGRLFEVKSGSGRLFEVKSGLGGCFGGLGQGLGRVWAGSGTGSGTGSGRSEKGSRSGSERVLAGVWAGSGKGQETREIQEKHEKTEKSEKSPSYRPLYREKSISNDRPCLGPKKGSSLERPHEELFFDPTNRARLRKSVDFSRPRWKTRFFDPGALRLLLPSDLYRS